MSGRRLIARPALGIVVIAAVWTAVLLLHGGFDTSVFGLRFRTNDPFRPFLLASAAGLIFVASVGDDSADIAMVRVRDSARHLLTRLSSVWAAVILAGVVALVGIAWGSKAAGGSDSYGYISQAELWRSGRLDVSQPWMDQAPWPGAAETFAPLGYHPGTTRMTIVPSYSSGLPMLMALAKLVGGQCAIFWIVPLCAGVMVLATFGLGRRVAGPDAGIIAAWLLATSPPFLFMLLVPMSDVAAAAGWTVVFWCVTAGTIESAVAGGLAATIAVLIRPNLAPLAVIALLWFALEVRSAGPNRWRYFLEGAGFLAGLMPGVVITAALNQHWYGSPFTSGYGTFKDIFSFGNIPPNARNYAAWLSQAQTPLAFLGIAALLVPIRWLWPIGARRSTVLVLGLFVAAVWLEYCAYLNFGAWWDLRFLLPASGFMMIGMAVVLLRVRGLVPATGAIFGNNLLVSLVVTFVAIVLGLRGVQFAKVHGAFDQPRWEMKYPLGAAIVASRTAPNAVIFSGLHSGSLRYYAGRMTLNYYALDPAWLERATAWLNMHGAHPYALLEEQEVKDFKNRFLGNAAAQAAMKPSVFYDGGSKLYFFDLVRPPDSTRPMETITEASPDVRCVSPARPPVFALK